MHLKPIWGFARPSGAQNPKSVAVQARRKASLHSHRFVLGYVFARIGSYTLTVSELMPPMCIMRIAVTSRLVLLYIS
jgi:hypothetical protein